MKASRVRIDVTVYAGQLRQAIAALLPAKGLALTGASRCCRWPDRLLVIGAVLMSWAAGGSILDRFAAARDALVRMYPSRRRPGRTCEGFVRKLARHTPRLLAMVVEALRRRTVESGAPRGKVGRWTLFGADSTKLDCPMTAANERDLGCASRAKSWPQVLLTTLVHLGTQLPWAWRAGPARASERGQLRLMLEELPADSMLVMDAGFVGFDLIKTILAQGRGRSILLRVGSNVRLLRKLGLVAREHEGIVYLWPAEAQRRKMTPLVLRKVEARDGRNRAVVLLTDVLDESLLSEAQALQVYRMRWGVELLYRAVKQTLGRRKLLSDSPAFAEVEAQWLMAGVWVLGLLMRRDCPDRAERNGPGVAPALRAVRAAMAGRIDGRRGSLFKWLRESAPDSYTRRGTKAARHWPHRKNPKPPGEPEARTATPAEVELARELRMKRQAA